MAKFKMGDKVRVVRGHNEGEVGVVTNPYWQIAANDWPFVLFTDDEGNVHSADDSNMVLVEDPTYEYNIRKGDDLPLYITWGQKASVEKLLFKFQSGVWADPDYRMVKRKKAGPIEDA